MNSLQFQQLKLLFCQKSPQNSSTPQRMPSSITRQYRERPAPVQKAKIRRIQQQSFSDSIPSPETSIDEQNVLQNNQAKQRHLEIKQKMMNPQLEKLPDPSLFSRKYDADDHEDLVHAFQQILQYQESQEIVQLNQTLQNQVQEILTLQKTYQSAVKPINDAINKEVMRLTKEQNGSDKGKKQIQQIIDQQNKVFDQLASLVKQQLQDQQIQLNYDNRLQHLQTKLDNAKDNLNRQYSSQELSLEQIFELYHESLALQQIFTNIQIAPGSNIKDLQTFQQQLSTQINAQQMTQDHFIFVNSIDRINYQGLLQVHSEPNIKLSDYTCTLDTLQMPQNVLQEISVKEMFNGQTQTALGYLWMVYKQFCTQYIRYKLSQEKDDVSEK